MATKPKKKRTKKTRRQTNTVPSESDGFREVGQQESLEVGEQVEGIFMGIKPLRSTVNDGIFHVIAMDGKDGSLTMTAGTVLFGRLLAGRPNIGDTLRIKREKDIASRPGLNPAKNFRVWIKRTSAEVNVPLVFDNVETPPQLVAGDTE